MKKITILSLMILLTGVLFTACKKNDKDVDTTPPQVNVISPEQEQSWPAGSDLYFSAKFSDNVDLGRYSMDIHEAFDGHGHGKNFAAFRYELKNQAITGKEHYVIMDVSIPEEAIPGKYHLTLYVTDQAGNSLNDNGANSKTVEFYILNDDFAPVFNINSPEHEQVYNHNDIININGSIKGFIDIEEVEIKIINKNTQEVVWDWEIDHVDEENYNLNQNVTVNSSWPLGVYEIEIEVELVNGEHYHLDPQLEIIIE